MSELTPAQVAAWFREQAAKYVALAEETERSFGLGKQGTNGVLARIEPKTTMPVSLPTPQAIKELMGTRKLRAKSIAAELGVRETSLAPVLTEENGFVLGERGWIGIKEENPK